MTVPHPLHSNRRRAGALTVVGVLLAALFASLLASGPASAVASPQADAAAAWVAAQVQPDGSTIGSSPTPSVNASVSAALSLAMTGTEDAALQRALGFIRANVDAYVDEGSGDLPGRLAYLIILADAVGDDPTAFGTPATDLVARLEALYGTVETGFYGTPNQFSATTDQSLAIIALVAAGATVPAGAPQWLLDQQCTGGSTPAAAEGGWQGYRATTASVLDTCVDPADPVSGYLGVDSNSSAVALQALAAVGQSSAAPSGTAFLRSLQASSGPAAGGFAYQPGFSPDPNSTALVIQAIVALGESPTGSSWSAGGASPIDALGSFVLTSGADAGALNSSFAPGVADFLATYQGVWGFTQTAFPFAQVPPVVPPTTSTTSTTSTTPPAGTGGTGGAATPISGTPAFTG